MWLKLAQSPVLMIVGIGLALHEILFVHPPSAATLTFCTTLISVPGLASKRKADDIAQA